MLRITGYSDKYSVCPGDNIQFHVNSENNESYDAQIVRLIHGDTNPDGPGYKEEEISAPCNRTWPGRNQRIHGGSYVIIPQDDRLNLRSFTLQAYIFPTTPDLGRQGIITKWVESAKCGYGLFIDDHGCLSVEIGDGKGQVMHLSSGKKLILKVWYLVAATFDANSGRVTLYQEPVVTRTNGGLGMSLLHPADETTARVEATNSLIPGTNDAPMVMAASVLRERSARTIFGAHYREARQPVELPEQTHVYNGKIDRPRVCHQALSKADIEALASGFQACSGELRNKVTGAWDFHANITTHIASTYIVDMSASALNGHAINLPARGMTGFNWSGDEIVYHHKPEEYGAIHFHDDDIDDARWDADFDFTIPEGLKSGVYAAVCVLVAMTPPTLKILFRS